MNKRRVFSKDSNISYNDYTRNKKGDEILKYVKSNNSYLVDRNFSIRHNELTSFLDYDTFLNLSRSYSRNYVPKYKMHTSPISVFDAKKSYLSYNQLSHMGDCNACHNNNNNITQVNECKEAKGVLYPYGNTVECTTNLQYPSKININIINCIPECECLEKITNPDKCL